MPRVWPLALAVLMTGCSSSMPPTGMQPPPPGYRADGTGIPDGYGPSGGAGPMFDPALYQPLQSGNQGLGILDQRPSGLLDQTNPFGPTMGGTDTPFGPPMGGGDNPFGLGMGGTDTAFNMGMGGPQSDGDGPLGSALSGLGGGEMATLADAPTAAAPAESATSAGQPHGDRQSPLPIVIASDIHTDPDAVRIQTTKVGDGIDVSLVVPMAGQISLNAQGDGPKTSPKTTLTVAGSTTARLRLAPAGNHLWKPAGIGVLTSRTTGAVPFAIARMTIRAEGHDPWTITDPAAIMALGDLPNLPPGAAVSVSVTLSGDTGKAMPFLVANGTLMPLTATVPQEAPALATSGAGTTYSVSFTLPPPSLKQGNVTLRKDSGIIGVKVITFGAKGNKAQTIDAVGWAVDFPSRAGKKVKGFTPLAGIDNLQRHVRTMIQLINQQENRAIAASGDARIGTDH
jgi:hypothetical protein